MKTIAFTTALLFCSLLGTSQNEREANLATCAREKTTGFYRQQLSPVYFHYRRRQLKDAYKNNIPPLEFLNLCRSINDSAVQAQVARYDNYTRDKQKLGLGALASGATAFALLGGSAGFAESQNSNASAAFGFFGAIAFLAIPAIAIYTSVPHQKRKAVLFRDLPIAYNQYIESQQ
jgi:hypothetical protein